MITLTAACSKAKSQVKPAYVYLCTLSSSLWCTSAHVCSALYEWCLPIIVWMNLQAHHVISPLAGC